MKTLFFKEDALYLIDQRFIPEKEEYFICKNTEDIYYAIKEMVVRGAPAIGITAAYGAYLAKKESKDREELKANLNKIKSSRPTAVNLEYAIEKAMELAHDDNCQEKLLALAIEIENREIENNKKMGEMGASLIKENMTLLTHCNTGSLATVGIGTALGVIKTAFHQGKNIKVYADETRPRLQGARLTAYELMKEGIPFKLISDSLAPYLIKEGLIDMIFLGADRIAKNGDTANKVGTFMLSLAAKEYGVPFYVVAPTTTFDPTISSGKEIIIEERDKSEVLEIGGVNIAPKGVDAYNLAFDITPWENITAIISEKGIHYPEEGGFKCMQ